MVPYKEPEDRTEFGLDNEAIKRHRRDRLGRDGRKAMKDHQRELKEKERETLEKELRDLEDKK